VELRQHLWCRALGAGCRQLFPPGSTWAGQEKKTFKLKGCTRESWAFIVCGFWALQRVRGLRTHVFLGSTQAKWGAARPYLRPSSKIMISVPGI
jgi:hypothetical protein